MRPAHHEEIREHEVKLRVDTGFRLPDLTRSVVGVHAVEEQQAKDLTAVYYDTEDLRLYRSGVTLRRRTGGSDEGWHLKLPRGDGDRDELRLPLSAGRRGAVPGEFADLVTALRREAPLVPVAVLHTSRAPSLLIGEDGEPFAELVDDVVEIRHDDRVTGTFREVEVESLRPDANDVIDAVAADLRDGGAVPETRPKVSSALGMIGLRRPDLAPATRPHADDPAGAAIRAHVTRHVQKFLDNDSRVRRDLPESVHDMRVAARHLRSTLKTFGPLVTEETADHLRDELHWVADGLGPVRDTEVLLRRLSQQAQALPESDAERARAAIDKELRPRLDQAREQALERLGSDRYIALLQALVAAANEPPLTQAATEQCADALPPLLGHSWKVLSKKVRRLSEESPATDWHEARKSAKRTRYAADLVAPILKGKSKKFAKRMSAVTDVLGDLHDAQVGEETLAELAQSRRVDSATGYALGLLAGRERERQAVLREQFRSIWPTAAKAQKKMS